MAVLRVKSTSMNKMNEPEVQYLLQATPLLTSTGLLSTLLFQKLSTRSIQPVVLYPFPTKLDQPIILLVSRDI